MFFSLFSFLFGLVIGSFLNCLIYRLFQKKTIFGRSFCPVCQHFLSFFDLVPVFSFLFLKGRCRYCQTKISWQYPLVEIVTGFLFLFSFIKLSSQFPVFSFQFLIILLRYWFIISVLIFIFVYDLKYMFIEEGVIVIAILIIFLLNLLIKIPFFSIVFGAFFGLGFFLIQYFLTFGQGIGEGDLLLGLLLGISFGWPKILITIFSAYIFGSLVSLFLLIKRKKKLTSKIPLGPFLAIGGLITLFFAEEIMNFWMSF